MSWMWDFTGRQGLVATKAGQRRIGVVPVSRAVPLRHPGGSPPASGAATAAARGKFRVSRDCFRAPPKISLFFFFLESLLFLRLV